MSNHPRRNWRARLAVDAEALGPDLVRAYVALHPTVGAALAALASATGQGYAHNRLAEWRVGSRPVPAPVQRVMRAAVLERLLGDAAHAIVATLEPP